MVRKATRAAAVLDVPDAQLRDEALRLRRGTLGEETYAERYRGLDHQYYERDWLAERFREAGCEGVVVGSQDIPGYANGAHRFNVLGWKSSASTR